MFYEGMYGSARWEEAEEFWKSRIGYICRNGDLESREDIRRLLGIQRCIIWPFLLKVQMYRAYNRRLYIPVQNPELTDVQGWN